MTCLVLVLIGCLLRVIFGACEARHAKDTSNDDDKGADVVHKCYIGRDMRIFQTVN